MITNQHYEVAVACFKKVFASPPVMKMETTEQDNDTLCIGDLFIRENEDGRYVVERMTIQNNYPDAPDGVDIEPVEDADHAYFSSALMQVVAQHAIDMFSVALEDTL